MKTIDVVGAVILNEKSEVLCALRSLEVVQLVADATHEYPTIIVRLIRQRLIIDISKLELTF